MNKIYKKIWNKARGCFVAVSEAVSSACQRAGKPTIIGISSLLLPLTTHAAVTLEGNHSFDEMIYSKHHIMASDYIVTGDLTVGNGSYGSVVWTSKDYTNNNQVLTVQGNLHIDNGGKLTVSHNGDGGAQLNGTVNVGGNLNVSGELALGSGNEGDKDSSISNLNVGNTWKITQTGFVDVHRDYRNTHINVYSKTIDSEGILDLTRIKDGSISTENLFVRGGTFNQTNNIQTYASNSLSVLGGTLSNESSLVVGGKSGQFSVGNSLTLGGGNLTNRNLLTQIAGNINITGGSYDFGTLNKSNGSLTNAGTLEITQFNQSGGSASNTGNLSLGNADLYGSLTSSGTLNFTGNVISRGNLSSTGTLNNRGSWTETDAFTITGNLNNTGAINFQNGFTFASNGKLNSSGTIQTNNASNVFDSLGRQGQTALTTVSINAQFPEETKTALTDLFRHYVPGSVAQNLIVHAKFTGGKVIVTGVNLTQTQAADLMEAFKSKFVVFEFYRLSSFSSSRRTK
ncbi:ESPR-type extended signal peptide-containing protein [Turicimonas muris]|uniref:ESPR-type extended signal peptide-containing protein n=2 Tax=Turicimonas muris TaxID=1796652 RepID=UPI0026F3E466|nr:ESPR-type extended signal peptide-containing protein [Turicimonas muris]